MNVLYEKLWKKTKRVADATKPFKIIVQIRKHNLRQGKSTTQQQCVIHSTVFQNYYRHIPAKNFIFERCLVCMADIALFRTVIKTEIF
jgi:hypothetical protein